MKVKQLDFYASRGYVQKLYTLYTLYIAAIMEGKMSWLERKAKIRVAGKRPRSSGGSSDFTWWVQQERIQLHPPPKREEIDDFQMWVANRVKNQGETMDHGFPIRAFYANCLRSGLTLRVVDGKLKVGGNTEILSPVYREEIIKRAEQLIEMLSPEVPEPLQPYFYRLLKVDEVKEAVGIAEQMGISLRQTPVNMGWLLEIANHRVSKVEKER